MNDENPDPRPAWLVILCLVGPLTVFALWRWLAGY